jgi:heptosyltransferase-2
VTGRVVVFAPNWLGDAVMALPALAAIRAAFPDAAVDVAARGSVAPLFTLVPGVTPLVLPLRRAEAVAALAERAYGVAVLFPNSFHTAWLARAASIAERWGYATDLRSFLLTRAVARPTRVHQAEFYSHLVRRLGMTVDQGVPVVDVSTEHRAAGAALLGSAGWDGRAPLVALAPGAAFGGAKRWPAGSFAELADRVAADGVRTVLIGTAADRAATREVLDAARNAPIDLTGRTDLPLLAGVLTHTRGLVTNDSGAMHLAAALGVNIVALFGPTRERETHPLGRGRQMVLTHRVWCRPCMLRECPLTHRCMRGITADRVLEEVRTLS